MEIAVVLCQPKNVDVRSVPTPESAKYVSAFTTFLAAQYYCDLMNEVDPEYNYFPFRELVLTCVPPLLARAQTSRHGGLKI